jgi:hypothetical protein
MAFRPNCNRTSARRSLQDMSLSLMIRAGAAIYLTETR